MSIDKLYHEKDELKMTRTIEELKKDIDYIFFFHKNTP